MLYEYSYLCVRNRGDRTAWDCRADLKSFQDGNCYYCPGIVDVKSEAWKNAVIWPRSHRQEVIGDFELAEAKSPWGPALGHYLWQSESKRKDQILMRVHFCFAVTL